MAAPKKKLPHALAETLAAIEEQLFHLYEERNDAQDVANHFQDQINVLENLQKQLKAAVV